MALQKTQIISRTISSIEDRRIQLAGSNIARKMSILDDWTTLRIGLRVCFVPSTPGTGFVLTGTPVFAFGVCSGVVNTYGSESPSHFVGIRTTSTSTEYKISGNDIYGATSTTSGCTWLATRYQNGSLTSGASGKFGAFSAELATIRSCLFLQLDKVGGNISVQLYAPTDVGAKTDISQGSFFNVMEGVTMTGLSNYTLNSAETISTLDEATYGVLDTVNVFWDRITQKMEICDIAYTRVS